MVSAIASADKNGTPATLAQGKLTLRQDGGAITILLVDDDPDCRMLLRYAISECKVSNAVFEVTNRESVADIWPTDDHVAPDGRVIDLAFFGIAPKFAQFFYQNGIVVIADGFALYNRRQGQIWPISAVDANG